MAQVTKNDESAKQIGAEFAGDVAVPSSLTISEKELQLTLKLRKWTLVVLLTVFSISCLATVTLFFLKGFGAANLSDLALGEFAGMTTAEIAGLLYIVTRFLFPASEKAKGAKR